MAKRRVTKADIARLSMTVEERMRQDFCRYCDKPVFYHSDQLYLADPVNIRTQTAGGHLVITFVRHNAITDCN